MYIYVYIHFSIYISIYISIFARPLQPLFLPRLSFNTLQHPATPCNTLHNLSSPKMSDNHRALTCCHARSTVSALPTPARHPLPRILQLVSEGEQK